MKPKNFIIIAVMVLMTLGATAQLPKIQVVGNAFKNDKNETVIFKGVSSSDPAKLLKDGHWNKAYFEEIERWGANLVRIPVHPANWRLTGSREYLKLLDQAVEWSTAAGLYVIIDWHSIGNLRTGMFQNPSYDTDMKETYNFWRTIALRYQSNSTVAFLELYNEPTTYQGQLGECSWAEWKRIMEELISIVRANGSDAIPLVAGFNWAYDLTEIRENPIDAEGIAYVSHPYPQKREKPWEEKWTEDWGYVSEKYPVILTEVGYCAPEDKGAHVPVMSDDSYPEILTTYCAAKGISYVVWVFDPNWAPAMFSDWNYTPTRQGKFFKELWRR